MVDKLHLTNMLRAKVEYNLDGGLPLDVFPDKIQEIILNLSRYENFNVEYVASIIISAMAAAIGNSYQINIRNEWKDSPSLYMMLIGRPGLGKTPPLNFLYKPINDLDDRLDEKYSEELEKYECAKQANGGNDKLKVPKWLTNIISDFTAAGASAGCVLPYLFADSDYPAAQSALNCFLRRLRCRRTDFPLSAIRTARKSARVTCGLLPPLFQLPTV